MTKFFLQGLRIQIPIVMVGVESSLGELSLSTLATFLVPPMMMPGKAYILCTGFERRVVVVVNIENFFKRSRKSLIGIAYSRLLDVEV